MRSRSAPEVAGLLDDGEGGVEGEVDAPHRLLRVAGDQADPVPGLGGVWRVEALDDLEHLAEGQVGGSLMWARPGSNRRPPRCKRGALPAELQAPAARHARQGGRPTAHIVAASQRSAATSAAEAAEVAPLPRPVDQGPAHDAVAADEEGAADRARRSPR